MAQKYHTGCLLAEGHPSCPLCDLYARDPARYAGTHCAPPGGRPAPPPTACVRRGAELRLVTCGTCPGSPRAKVHACDLHGECTLFARPIPGVRPCAGCPDRDAGAGPPPALPPAGVVEVVVSANGIGDQVLGLCVLDGLRAKHPGQELRVIAKSWCAPWAALFEGYDSLATARTPGATEYDPYRTYARQTADRLARPRWEYYAEACGVRATAPRPRPVAPEAAEWARRYAGRVILAPFSTDALRTWSVPHWLTLERLLSDRGFETVVIDDRADRLAPFASHKLVGESPARVGALLHAASCVVGNDSGMTHVAAALGTPTVALSASIRGDHVFGLYPCVRVVAGPLDCGNCHGRDRPDGKTTRARLGCLEACHNLQGIDPARVLAAVEELACWRARPFTLLTPDRLAVIRRAARETARLPGVNAELGVFRGGSALMMADAAPGKTLRLFDTFAGLPSTDTVGDRHYKGEFACGLADVRERLAGYSVVPHEGVFPETAKGLEGERYACVHVDGDLYETTRDAIAYFWPRMVPGGVILWDDYAWRDTPGVAKALHEAFAPDEIRVSAFHQALTRKPS